MKYFSRSLADMINNCGIVIRLPEYTDADVLREFESVYRSSAPGDVPKSEEMEGRGEGVAGQTPDRYGDY
jgi:hypothetical protein